MSIKDDGRGFEMERLPVRDHTGGFGVTGMIERTRLLGGRLQIESEPGKGTRIRAVVPLGGLP
jgi:signal transduction histidine kinase